MALIYLAFVALVGGLLWSVYLSYNINNRLVNLILDKDRLIKTLAVAASETMALEKHYRQSSVTSDVILDSMDTPVQTEEPDSYEAAANFNPHEFNSGETINDF